LEFRLMNTLETGQTLSTGEVAQEWPFKKCLEILKPHYERAKKETSAFKEGKLRRGVGIAGAAFGIGGGFYKDAAYVAVELNPDGGITVYGSIADPGEGNDAMLTQLAAHLMDLPIEKIRLVTRDTERTPNSGAAAGSRITYMAGGALVDGIAKLKEAMKEAQASTYSELVAAGKPSRYMGEKSSDSGAMDPKTGQGKFYDTRVLGCQMAEVEVDIETGEVRVLKMTAVEDIGKVINPQAVEGQMEGGIDMGVGMALREEYIHGQTNDFRAIHFPTMKTSFDIQVIPVETPREKGPLGATGVGEFVLLPSSAAVLNAIEDATGVRIYDLPAKPERVLAALQGKRG
jgi:aldehyde oxidoreductase